MRLKADDFVFKEKRVHLKQKYIAPVFVAMGNGIPKCNAHCSVYSVTAKVAKQIELSGSIRKYHPAHYSRYLIMDVDSRIAGQNVTERLIELDINFKRYDSGHKGFHFAILRDAEPSEHLCYQDKDLVFELFKGIEYFCDIDQSIYQPLRVIRAVSAVHEKSKKRKTLDMERDGSNRLSVIGREVSVLQKSVMKFDDNGKDTDYNRLRHAFALHNGDMSTKYHNLWAAAKDFLKAGLSLPATLEIVNLYNQNFDSPKEYKEVERAVNDARRAVFGK